MKTETERTTRNGKGKLPICLLIFVLTVGGVMLTSMLLKQTQELFLRNTVMSAICAGSIIYALLQSVLEGKLSYDNSFHLWRFLHFYLISLALSLLFTVLPVSGWPFLALSVALAMFSNELVGIFSTATLVFISVGLTDASTGIFLLYFITGLVGILLFRKIDENFKVLIPATISLMLLFVAETAVILICYNEHLRESMFVVPMLNLFLNSIFLVIILKLFSSSVIHKYRLIYMEINDPEFRLMSELKEKSIDSYHRSIHTAYFCERIANVLQLDTALCKAGGYYHRLDEFTPLNDMSMIQTMEEEYHFPPAVLDLLEACNEKEDETLSKEAAVVKMSDIIVSSILFLIQKDSTRQLDYHQVVEAVFEKKLQSGMFDRSALSFAEFHKMKAIFMEEKLYYDFLR